MRFHDRRRVASKKSGNSKINISKSPEVTFLVWRGSFASFYIRVPRLFNFRQSDLAVTVNTLFDTSVPQNLTQSRGEAPVPRHAEYY